METESFDTIVIGGGQAGLAVGHHLARQRRSFVILEADRRIGDVWRTRWDSLRLFTPARNDGLPGWRFPAAAWSFPTKDDVAAYLEAYATKFSLPVRTGVRVTRLAKQRDRFVVETPERTFEADNVVLATGQLAKPHIPELALDLDARTLQLHSSEYRSPAALRAGKVLVVGAGNSGAEIALEVSATHETWLSGRYQRMPIGPTRSRVFATIAWPILTHVMTIRTPIGRKMRARMRHGSAPVERVSLQDLERAGVHVAPRVEAARDGRPVLADGSILEVDNVIWCTGFRPGLDWVDLPIFDPSGDVRHARGVATDVDGLYFVGRLFQYGFTSVLIGGVGRDAAFVARRIASRAEQPSLNAAQRPARA